MLSNKYHDTTVNTQLDIYSSTPGGEQNLSTSKLLIVAVSHFERADDPASKPANKDKLIAAIGVFNEDMALKSNLRQAEQLLTVQVYTYSWTTVVQLGSTAY
jgi:hypothetical protein